MNRIAIEVGTQPLVMQLSGVVELTITAGIARESQAHVEFANWKAAETVRAALLRATDRVR